MSDGLYIKERTPVDHAFYESLVMRDRWNVGRLYAANTYESQAFEKQVKYLARERRTNLLNIERNIDSIRNTANSYLNQKEALQQPEKMRQMYRKEKSTNFKTQSSFTLPPVNKNKPRSKSKALKAKPSPQSVNNLAYDGMTDIKLRCLDHEFSENNYNEFYKNHDFSKTKARYIPRSLQSNPTMHIINNYLL